MNAPVVAVDALSKHYLVPVREAGVRAALVSLVRRNTQRVDAVRQVSFRVARGEIVGFLGPNGAGKTTTLKMLSGLLHPSEGDARVLGYQPWQRDKAFLKQMTLVMGQRNQLVWDIPVMDSLERNRAIYDIDTATFRQRLDELAEMLALTDLLTKPVRNLSLGERMKCEVAAALLHHPQVLFLDEPTIGLDVTMQRRLRDFVADFNRKTGATVLLTSHYMADVKALCERVIVIHHGAVRFDGALANLVDRFSEYKTIAVQFEAEPQDLSAFGEVMSRDGSRASVRVRRGDAARVTGAMLSQLAINDLTIEEPPIEEVIERIFASNVDDDGH